MSTGKPSLGFFLAILILLPLMLLQCGDDDTTTGTDPADIETGDTVGDTTGDTTQDTTLPDPGGALIADHNAANAFSGVPIGTIEQAATAFNMYYGHTSHGSQIMTGLDMVEAEDGSYNQPSCYEISDDLGHLGDLTWVSPTRTYLDNHTECNLVVWSWCGGVSDNTVEGINTYLDAMNTLETDYPNVIFIYMTGHLDGTGVTGNLYQRNNQIRQYCGDNDKILFDFADIESYDPDGGYYPDADDSCPWCYDWCAANPCESCASCAHSHCFNCYRKGQAFWWLLARLTDWGTS